ncbi:hypothetical protein PPYR_13590 [Photinus pyralis]|uniref:Uncharacterized protein n=1 Tax=Photinus pyralis TaxID=7054 RepID=A0A5N4A9G8_PHOPY|nr:uncharacterized protein LOC116179507 [Photinus pyralis]KAB0793970.1 hypothetical protein PPYR_13590 [Photinus pyralis]
MILTVLTIFLIKSEVSNLKCADDISSDFYWRDYFGEIPSDALGGGYDKAGNPAYIGQLFNHKDGLLPAMIYEGDQSLYATVRNAPLTQQKYGKILCSHNPCKYKWIPTDTSKVQSLFSNYTVISGGYENAINIDLYIGRIHYDLEIRIGKVIVGINSVNGIHIPFGKSYVHFKSYEILVYDKNAKC